MRDLGDAKWRRLCQILLLLIGAAIAVTLVSVLRSRAPPGKQNPAVGEVSIMRISFPSSFQCDWPDPSIWWQSFESEAKRHIILQAFSYTWENLPCCFKENLPR